MKFQKRILASLVLASTVFFVSCEENSLIDPPSGTPMAPTNVLVSTRSETSIAVRWSRPSADTVTATGYDVIATPASGSPITVSASGTDSIATVTGLTEGTIYTFTVRAKAGSNMSAASSGVMWAPAKRTTVAGRMYVSASSQGSGLNLATGANLTIANGGQWDLCLDDKDGNILVGSPGVSGYVTEAPNGDYVFSNGQLAKIVRLRGATYRATSLNDIWESSSLGDGNISGDGANQFKERLFDLGTINAAQGGLGFVAAVFSGANTTTPINYAKVLVKSVGGSFVQGTGSGRYVEVEVSYQTAQNTPYAISKIVDFGGARSTSNMILKASN
ncbi:MAG: fibronectin type III domain-containing protein [Candidatus Kapabacteria bacterium]|nr:fibronectin type III domain-containing protein [Candidatus Kapabacteria bacterium]